MLIVRGVNVFPSALEGIVRRFPAVDEFLIEVYRRSEMDEVRLLVEVTGDAAVVGRAVGAGGGARRPRHPRRGGARAGRSLPRYELKARRLVRRTASDRALGLTPNRAPGIVRSVGCLGHRHWPSVPMC